jgi:hypothetical protein
MEKYRIGVGFWSVERIEWKNFVRVMEGNGSIYIKNK